MMSHHPIQKIEHWGDVHHPWWMDILRIALGLALSAKGIQVIATANKTLSGITDPDILFAAMVLTHFIAITNISGGIVIALGLMTRFVVLVQIPVLLVAFFLVNYPGKLVFSGMELVQLLIVLPLLILIFVEGPGVKSADHYIDTHPED